MYHIFHWLAKKKFTIKNKSVTAPILKPTYDQKQETFWGALESKNNNGMIIVPMDQG